jgi:hypothetical protein
MRTFLLLAAAMVSCAGEDVASFTGKWSGQARFWQGPAKPESILIQLDVRPDGSVDAQIGGARCSGGRLEPRKWWQFPAFNHYQLRIDCTLEGELVPGVRRQRGSVALNIEGPELRGWFFSEGHDGFPLLAKPTQARASGLVLRRT